jgi:serine/threonine protein kinase/tetratricopeptide (TPR) repeat protein
MPAGEELSGGGSEAAGRRNDEATVLPGAGSRAEREPSGDSPTPAGVAPLEQFSRALVEIGLISQDELDSFKAESSEGVLGLSRALVKAGRLTPYQAAAVYQKKSRGLLIGNYIILEKLGQGGMGVVFKARHRRLGRVGALKILPPSFARDRDAVLRFRREVEAAGRLQHPNLVAAQDADEDRGVHFLVMDFVEGRDLDHTVREKGPMAVTHAIDCMIQAARGLEAAHAQGIIHRDIKPANLMLDQAGIVRVLDLGLARIVDAGNPFGKSTAGRLTQSGMYMGTVDYMAPEQAEDSHRVDHRADIYSLGCSIYYLLTGREPFSGETVLKRLMSHMERPAPSLKPVRPDVPAALDAAYLKMMAKRPEDRPASMSEVVSLLEAAKLAPDLGKTASIAPPKSKPELKVFNEQPLKRPGSPRAKSGPPKSGGTGEPADVTLSDELSLADLVMDVRSEPPPTPLPRAVRPMPAAARRSSRKARRPELVWLAAAAAAALVATLAGFAYFRRPSAGHVPAPPRADDQTTVTGNDEDDPPPVDPPAEPAVTALFDGKTGKGWMLCDRKPLPQSNVQVDGLNPHNSQKSYLVVYDQPLGDFVLDFDYLLTKGCNSGVFLRVGDLNDPVNSGIEVAIDDIRRNDNRDSGGFYGLVAPRAFAQKAAGRWNHMTITAVGPRISVVLNNEPVSSINLEEWTVAGKTPTGQNHKFTKVALAKLDRTGFVGFQDLGADCWYKNVILKNPPSAATNVAGRSSSNTGGTPPASSSAADPEPYVETGRFLGHGGEVSDVAVSPDGRLALSSGGDAMVRLWDIATRRELYRFAHSGMVWSVAFSPDGRRALSASHDQTVGYWDLTSGKAIFRSEHHSNHAKAVAFFPDGQRALSCGDDDKVVLWDLQSAEPGARVVAQHTADVQCLAISRDGLFAVSGGDDQLARVWNCTTWKELAELPGHKQTVTAVAFSPSGDRILTADAGSNLILWDRAGRKELFRLTLSAGESATSAVFLTDGQHIVAAGNKGRLAMWNIESRALVRAGTGPAPHLGVAALPDGRVLTSDGDSIVRIWSPSRSIALARELTSDGEIDAAIAEYGKAIEQNPRDVRLQIERGRLLAVVGHTSQADHDFVRAAELAPDDPQLFLEAGWWVAGPYPPNFDARVFQSDPAADPAKPLPKAGNEPMRWQTMPTGARGRVDLGAVFHREQIAGYALAIVYSTTKREIVLLAGTDDAARVWQNGKLVLDSRGYSAAGSHIIVTTLEPGRNAFLAKVINGGGAHDLYFRIGTDPRDFARAFARLKRWPEAARQYAAAIARDPSIGDAGLHRDAGWAFAELGGFREAAAAYERAVQLEHIFEDQRLLSRCYLALRDTPSYQRLCEAAMKQFGRNQEKIVINSLVWQVALIPGAIANVKEAVNLGRSLMNAKPPNAAFFNTFGGILYRDKQYNAAIGQLQRSIDAQKGVGNRIDWLMMAMARHKLKMPDARQALDKAQALAARDSMRWDDRVEWSALLDEAKLELDVPRG